MWDTVVAEYGKNPKVYFEPMNEPFGYTLDEWVSLTSGWLDDHADVPRSRVIISGTGYNDNVTGVGAAEELDGTLLSLHFYGFWASDTTEEAWKANLLPRIGEYGWRTLVSEAGSPMTTGLNYGNHEGDVSTSYLGALTEVTRDQGMGVVYWPGLRTGDSYTLTEQNADGGLTVTNESGLAQLQWGWGLLKTEPLNDLPPAPPGEPLRSIAHNVCIDVPGGSTAPGTLLGLWYCNGGGNQSFNWTDAGAARRSTAASASNPSTVAGALVDGVELRVDTEADTELVLSIADGSRTDVADVAAELVARIMQTSRTDGQRASAPRSAPGSTPAPSSGSRVGHRVAGAGRLAGADRRGVQRGAGASAQGSFGPLVAQRVGQLAQAGLQPAEHPGALRDDRGVPVADPAVGLVGLRGRDDDLVGGLRRRRARRARARRPCAG